eukprot:6815833-Alexandrium_andersonii.AAC.1
MPRTVARTLRSAVPASTKLLARTVGARSSLRPAAAGSARSAAVRARGRCPRTTTRASMASAFRGPGLLPRSA